jgi:hypothetical protein
MLSQGFLPPAIRKEGHELLDHQCWVFGRDVLNRENNLLIKNGFTQVRCPNGGLTQYELRHGLDENSHVFLWGFGAFFGSESEGIFLSRSGFTPFRTQGRVELHDRDYHPFVEESSNIRLLLGAIAWFANYEDWIPATRLSSIDGRPSNTSRAEHCKDPILPFAGERLRVGLKSTALRIHGKRMARAPNRSFLVGSFTSSVSFILTCSTCRHK